MAYDFPNAPTLNQIFPSSGPGQQWQWDGTKWVAYNVASGGAQVIISDTAPASPIAGTLWFDSLGTQLYIWESDGNSTQWVPVVNQGGALTLATATNVGRNLIHNPLFNIQQRGAGAFSTTAAFTADRWQMGFSGGPLSVAMNAANDTIRGQIGDETASSICSVTCTGGAAAGDYSLVGQGIENVRRLAGKTVTVSFWAASGAGTPKIGVSLDQSFGSGGSPSADVNGTGQSVTIGTTYQRYTLTFTLPSISGKTLGTNNNDKTAFSFWFSSGATNNTRAGGIGVQTATFGIWGVQLELGNAATPLEKIDPQIDLAKCQRFYQFGVGTIQAYGAAGQAFNFPIMLPVAMRAGAPTATQNLTGGVNYTPGTASANQGTVILVATVTALGAVAFNYSFTASADL